MKSAYDLNFKFIVFEHALYGMFQRVGNYFIILCVECALIPLRIISYKLLPWLKIKKCHNYFFFKNCFPLTQVCSFRPSAGQLQRLWTPKFNIQSGKYEKFQFFPHRKLTKNSPYLFISRCISSNHLRKELWRKAKVNEFSLNDETSDLKWHSIVVVDVAEEKEMRCHR